VISTVTENLLVMITALLRVDVVIIDSYDKYIAYVGFRILCNIK